MDTYEKKYKETLERANIIYTGKYKPEIAAWTKKSLEAIFPELQESEDERIRQKFIKLVKMSSEVGGFALHKWEADEMLIWLEKQGEQKSINDLSSQEAMDIAVAKCFEQGEQNNIWHNSNEDAKQNR